MLTDGVIALTYEFILSCLIVVGGGWLIYAGHDATLAASVIGAVVTFWFTNRQSDKRAADAAKAADAAASTTTTQTTGTGATTQPTGSADPAPLNKPQV